MATLPLWEYIAGKIAVIEDRLLSDILKRYHCCRDVFLE